MRHSFGQGYGVSASLESLVRITAKPKHPCRVVPAADTWIMPCIDVSQAMIPISVVIGDAVI
jgi:hypothetical protein